MGWLPEVLQGGRKPTARDILSSAQWACITCQQAHEGLFALAAFAPDPWQGRESYEHNGAIRLEGDFLSEDLCVIEGKHFLVRAVLEIPIIGMDEVFSFGAWSTLSRENFDKYLAGFDFGDYPDMGPWPGWLCNKLERYLDNDPVAVWVAPQSNRQRPRLFVQNDEHPLAIDQDNGITPERALEIYAFYGHYPSELA